MEAPGSGVDRGALGLMGLTILLWAGSWIAMKLVVPYIGPFDFVVLRYISGGLLLLAMALALRRPMRPPSWKLTVLAGLTQTAAFQALVQSALIHGNVGKTSLMAYTMPFWVVLFSWWFLAEKPTRGHWVGIACAAAGLVCVIEPWSGLSDAVSVILALGGGLCWGIGTVLAKVQFLRHRTDVMVFTGWQMLVGGVAVWPVAWAVPQIAPVWNMALILGMLYIVLLASAAGWLLWFAVVQRLPASIAGLSGLGTPVVAGFLAWILMGERPNLVESGGMLLILYGLFRVARAATGQRPTTRSDKTAREPA